MYKKIIINVAEHETRVALLEDETIAELFIERRDNTDIAGNIYKGRVQRVLPGMQAAFVNIGLDQSAFLYVDDVLGDNSGEFEKLFNNIDDLDDDASVMNLTNPAPSYANRNYHIEELLTESQELMVHVVKSPLGTKGSRVTSHISLPGHYLVLMPTSDHIGVSKRIENETERNRLKNLILSLRKEDLGFIVRTVGESKQEEKFVYEMNFLINLWKNIQKKSKSFQAPALLHQELNVILRAVRDLLTHEADKLIIDSRTGYESVLLFLDEFMPSLKDSLELYEGTESIFDAYNLEGDISRALKRKVWLKSGGYIVIEHTEALVAIDVNTGRYVGKHNLEETILKTNLEAVKEIAYQIRLRDLGGIIIIDFIDMEKKSNQEKVFNALKEAVQKDRSKTNILPLSEMGLIQMTRKRIRKPLTQILCEPCFYCEGEGYQISRQTICYNIYREIVSQVKEITGIKLTLKVNPEIAELLHGEESHIITSLENIIGKQIVIYPNSQFHMEEFDTFETHKI